MELKVHKIPDMNVIIVRDNFALKEIIEDNIENRKAYGIPILPIYGKNKEIIKPVVKQENYKYISLTFDDGPTKYTFDILNLLNEYKAKATFFILGSNIEENKKDISLISSFGNEIGIHGYSHIPFTKRSIEAVKEEIDLTYDMLYDLGVNPTRIVRPPFGKLNGTLKSELNTPLVLANIDGDGSSKEEIIDNVLDNIEEGSIIKMHESKVCLDALKELLPKLIEEGYKFVTVSDMNRRYDNRLVPGRVYAKIKVEK